MTTASPVEGEGEATTATMGEGEGGGVVVVVGGVGDMEEGDRTGGTDPVN